MLSYLTTNIKASHIRRVSKCGLHSCKCHRSMAVTSAGLHASVQMHSTKGGGVLGGGVVPTLAPEPQPCSVRHT